MAPLRPAWIACFALVLLAGPVAARPESDHVVSPSELDRAVRNAAQSRQDNLAKLDRFVASPEAQKALQGLKVDPERVSRALPMLSDAELARLAERSDAIQNDPAAGGLGTLLLFAVVVAVLIVVLASVKL